MVALIISESMRMYAVQREEDKGEAKGSKFSKICADVLS